MTRLEYEKRGRQMSAKGGAPLAEIINQNMRKAF